MKYDKDMLYIKQMEKGERLYHYTTTDALIGIVDNKELWITKWNYLNDIDEFRVAVEALADVLKEKRIDQRIINDVKNNIEHSLFTKDVSDDYYVLSTSCVSDSQLMWSYYSNRDGVSIEIDFQTFCDLFEGSMMWHGLVNYDFDSQRDNIEKSLRDELLGVEDFGSLKEWADINYLSGKEYNMLIAHMSIVCELYSMFYKRNCYAEEKEYRFVFSKQRCKPKTLFRSKNGVILPYISNQLKSLGFVSGVVLGPTNNMDNALGGITELLRYNNCNAVVSKSKVPLRF